MTPFKIRNLTIEVIISFVIASIVVAMLNTSDSFINFAQKLNIESKWGVNLLAYIIAITVGGIVLITLTKIFKFLKK